MTEHWQAIAAGLCVILIVWAWRNNMKEIAYKIFHKTAYCCLSLACKMIGLMMRYYESEIVYKVLGTKHGYNIEFIFLPDNDD